MKTKNILLASIATISLIGLGFNYSYAMNGNGMGNGQGQGQQTGSMSLSKQQYNPSDLIVGIETQELSEAEKEMLYYGYSEESLAHDMYMYFYELYGVQVFKNISDSETEHKDAVKSLLDRYALEVPTGYGELTDEFDALKAEGSISLLKALEVGVKIEMLDIEDITETIKTTDNTDFKIIFTNIGGASYNHLRGFLSAINIAGLTTTIDYSEYLTSDEVNTKGGTLKYKMAEKLESEGVILPTQASSNSIKENCAKEEANKNQGQSMGNSSNANKGNGAVNSNFNSLKNKYKNTIDTRYTKTLSKMNNAELTNLVSKIDLLSKEIQTKNYTTITKQNYNAMLSVLRDLALEKISE
ncbi:MAG: DUF2202 domain-containing protein [Candidatus Gracilibacteria bacterium]|nr:DUF2202 domain-containing protein [Candidatus Gracilibacteria bacterium]